MVPTGTGKPGKMGKHFPVREKSGNYVKTGKVREFYSKYWKNQKMSGKFVSQHMRIKPKVLFGDTGH